MRDGNLFTDLHTLLQAALQRLIETTASDDDAAAPGWVTHPVVSDILLQQGTGPHSVNYEDAHGKPSLRYTQYRNAAGQSGNRTYFADSSCSTYLMCCTSSLHSDNCMLSHTGKEVIISRRAAEAVLRGAHVFVPGDCPHNKPYIPA